jgi:hypothetical protein
MRDYYTVNRRVHDLRAALEALEKTTDPESKKKQLAALRELLEQKVELRQSENDALLTQHVGPLEARAQKRLADDAACSGERERAATASRAQRTRQLTRSGQDADAEACGSPAPSSSSPPGYFSLAPALDCSCTTASPRAPRESHQTTCQTNWPRPCNGRGNGRC